KPSAKIETILKTDSDRELQVLYATTQYIKDVARVETLHISSTDFAPTEAITAATLSVAEAAEMIEESQPKSPGSAVEQTQENVLARFLEQPSRYFDNFFVDYKKPALSLAILLGVGVTYKVLHSMLEAIDDVPGLAGIFQLVGIGYSIQFGVRRVLKGETRDRVLTQLKEIWSEVAGNPQSPEATAAAQSVSQPSEAYRRETQRTSQANEDAELQLIPAPAGVTSAELIRATSDTRLTDSAQADQRKMFAGVTGTVQVLIPLTGVVDVEALRAKLEKDLSKAEGEIKSLGGRLSNQGFVDKAPAEVVQGARDALAEAEKQAKLVHERLAML
ncbi:MAG: CAAD domain-containing protein, partial [Phormidesmis sp.]